MQHLLQRTVRTLGRYWGALLALCLLLPGLGLLTCAAADGSPEMLWIAHFPAQTQYLGGATAMALDSRGNIYVTGPAGSNANADYATVKYDGATGQQLWAARYDGPGHAYDGAYALAVDGAGNVYVTGISFGSGTDYDYATVKYDGATGQQLWVARYDGPAHSYDRATALALDGAGNVYVTGFSHSGTYDHYATVKYDGTSGQQLWVARVLYGFSSEATALALDGAGNVYVTGFSFSGTSYDYATVKYAGTSGQQLWVASYDGPAHVEDRATALAVDGAGNVYVTGYSPGRPYSSTYRDYATVKYDAATGQQLWVARYDGPGHLGDEATALAVDSAGNVYVTGTSGQYLPSDPSRTDYATVKYDGVTGQQLWAARYDVPFYSIDEARALAVDGAGNVYVTGSSAANDTTYSAYATVKYDGATGRQLWAIRYDGPSDDAANALAVDGAGNVYITGRGSDAVTGDGFFTIKYHQNAPTVTDLAVTDTSATLTWNTSQATTSSVEYGLTASYGKSVTEGTYGSSHHVTLTGLTPETTYFYRVVSRLPDGTMFEQAGGTFTTAIGNYTISGKVAVGGLGYGGAQVSGGGQTATSAADGTYTLSGIKYGNYLVQAIAIGYKFPNQVVQVGPSKTGVDFSAPFDPELVGPFTISGKVTAGGMGLGGALVSAAGQTVTTAPDGNYTLTGVGTGNYLVQCHAIGYTFTDRTALVGPSQTNVDFSAPFDPALTGPFTVSGRVTVGGVGVWGVLVAGGAGVTFTAPDGSYTLTGFTTGNYGILAVAPGYAFPMRTALLGPSKTGVDFALP